MMGVGTRTTGRLQRVDALPVANLKRSTSRQIVMQEEIEQILLFWRMILYSMSAVRSEHV